MGQTTQYLNIGLNNGVVLRTVMDPIKGSLTDTRTRYVVCPKPTNQLKYHFPLPPSPPSPPPLPHVCLIDCVAGFAACEAVPHYAAGFACSVGSVVAAVAVLRLPAPLPHDPAQLPAARTRRPLRLAAVPGSIRVLWIVYLPLPFNFLSPPILNSQNY